MTDTIYWPGEILKPQTISVDIAHRNLRSPTAANGFTQVVSNSAGIWKVSFQDIPVYTKEMIKLWRAIDTLAEGQLYPISIPVWDLPRSPGSTDDYGTNVASVVTASTPHSDDTFFSDTSGYESSYTNVYTISSATTGSVTLSLTKSAPTVTLEPGQRFSVNDRLYQIQRIQSQDASTAVIVVRPPLREDVPSGTRCEFDKPRLLVRLTDDNAMFLPLNFNQQSFPPLDFIEYL